MDFFESIDLNQILPIVLSSAISVFAILVPAYRAKLDAKLKLNELYFNCQREAYQELFLAIAELDYEEPCENPRDFRRLKAASKNAQLVSTITNSRTISNFVAVYIDTLAAIDDGNYTNQIEAEYQNAMELLTLCLQTEMLRFDKDKRALDKQLERIKHYSNRKTKNRAIQ